MRKYLLMLPLILLVGCTTEIKENKHAYLTYKNELQEQEKCDDEAPDFNTFFNIESISEEEVNYSMIINNPKINMYDVKALLIHDYLQEDAFPSSGIMDESVDLLKESNDKIELKGSIRSVEDISDIKFKLYLEYTDDNNETNKIYYQVSKG